MSEAYDNDIVGTRSNPGGPTVESGLFSRVSSQLSYAKRSDRLRFFAEADLGSTTTAKSKARFRSRLIHTMAEAGITFSTRRAVVDVSQSISYYPFFGYDLSSFGPPLDPGVSLGDNPDVRPGPDAALFESPVITYRTSASAAFPMGRRATTTFDYSFSGSEESRELAHGGWTIGFRAVQPLGEQ